MLSRFFSNSKPIVLVGLLIMTSLWFWGFSFWGIVEAENQSLQKLTINWLVLLSIVIIADFINKKSKINKQNSYALVSLVMLILSTPEVFYERNILLPSLFLILAIRRIINLQNPANTKKKIFEASFWLFFATLYEPWLALGYAVLYFATFYFVAQNFKNFFIPLFGVLGSFTLLQLYHVLVKKDWFLFPQDYFSTSLELTNWIEKPHVYLIAAYALLAIWGGIHTGKILKKAKISKKTNLGILSAFVLIGIINASFSSNYIAQELLFVFLPLSFLLGSYFELKQRKIIKEVAFGILLCLPIIKITLLLVN